MAELRDVTAPTAEEHRKQGVENLFSGRLTLRLAARELDGQPGHAEALLAISAVDDALEAAGFDDA